MRFFIAIILAFSLIGCGKHEGGSDPTIIFESVIYIHWEDGTETAHYMYGPAPGEGGQFIPGPDWYFALRGATAHALLFFFDQQPTQHVLRAVWRTVWVPRNTEARLIVNYGLAPDRPTFELVSFSPTTFDARVNQDIHHPTDFPRVVDVEVTDFINQSIDTGMITHIAWQVRESR